MRRGSVIVAVLLLVSLFFVIGVALLSRQVLAYRGAAQARAGLQALALAEAGLEDARIKLEKDPFFPPPGGPDQQTFAYSEAATDLDGNPVGSYHVTVDRSRIRPPFLILRVLCVGVQGDGTAASARKSLVAEFDVSKTARGDPAQKNPNLYRLVRVSAQD